MSLKPFCKMQRKWRANLGLPEDLCIGVEMLSEYVVPCRVLFLPRSSVSAELMCRVSYRGFTSQESLCQVGTTSRWRPRCLVHHHCAPQRIPPRPVELRSQTPDTRLSIDLDRLRLAASLSGLRRPTLMLIGAGQRRGGGTPIANASTAHAANSSISRAAISIAGSEQVHCAW